MGVKLFQRSKKKLYPTAAGTIYLEAARKVLTIKNRTLYTINRLEHSPTDIIKIALTPYRGANIYSHVYSKFMHLYPTIELKLVELFSSHQEDGIHNSQVDFAFGVNTHVNYEDVHNLAICQEELLLAVPNFHPLAKYASYNNDNFVSMPIRAFWDMPFVLPGKKNNIRIVADKLFQDASFSPVIAFESDNGMIVDAMIRQGVGFGLVAKRYFKKDQGVAYFRLEPPCFEISYLRYATNKIFTDASKYLCGLIISEKLKSNNHTLIQSDEVAKFLNKESIL